MDYNERRKAQGRQTEQTILQAASELMREQGFDKVSIRDICRRASITTGAFYHHFASKEDLLVRGFAPLDIYMEQAMVGHEEDAPFERLRLLLTAYTGFMETQGPALVGRYYEHRLSLPTASSADATRYTHRALLSCLKSIQAQGSLVPTQEPEWVADFLFRHFRGVVIDWILHSGSYSLLHKLEQDYTLFEGIFRQASPQ